MLQPKNKHQHKTASGYQTMLCVNPEPCRFGQRSEHLQWFRRVEELHAGPLALRKLKLELENLKKLQCFLASEEQKLQTKEDADAYGYSLFVSRFEPGP